MEGRKEAERGREWKQVDGKWAASGQQVGTEGKESFFFLSSTETGSAVHAEM